MKVFRLISRQLTHNTTLCISWPIGSKREDQDMPNHSKLNPFAEEVEPGKNIKAMNKELELGLAKIYKDILQNERARMDENQRRVQEMLVRERERSDKKQEEMQNQLKQFLRSIQTLLGVGGLLGLVYYIFTVVNQGGDAFEKIKKYWNEGYSKYELIQKYCNTEQKLPNYYLKGNSIEAELAKVEFDGVIGLSYIVGIPGSGKTTALKKIINDLRLKIKKGEKSYWRKVYYINLRVDDENGKMLPQKTKQRIEQMSQLLNSIFAKEEHYKKALIVIDDIQMLEKVLSEVETKQILQAILCKCEMESCKFVVVSSSSLSCYRALSNANFRKSAYITEIQNLSQEELRVVIDNRLKYEKELNGIDIPNSIVAHVQHYDSIRSIMNSINLVVNEFRVQEWAQRTVQEAKLLEKVQDSDSNKIWDMKIEMVKVVREKSAVLGSRAVAEIIKCILKQPTELKLRDKFAIIDEVVKKIPSLINLIDEISSLIDELDKKNILIFGHPRSRLERKALDQILKGLI